ncbi:hypothetical protein FJTKL_03618 [Diaporthe vaccinii]|uniref:Uncharacterized protein n=1 Tax=Diaporthe vaccinii TaxID=105482 RepID=A0ABR4DV03_9PEZI
MIRISFPDSKTPTINDIHQTKERCRDNLREELSLPHPLQKHTPHEKYIAAHTLAPSPPQPPSVRLRSYTRGLRSPTGRAGAARSPPSRKPPRAVACYATSTVPPGADVHCTMLKAPGAATRIRSCDTKGDAAPSCMAPSGVPSSRAKPCPACEAGTAEDEAASERLVVGCMRTCAAAQRRSRTPRWAGGRCSGAFVAPRPARASGPVLVAVGLLPVVVVGTRLLGRGQSEVYRPASATAPACKGTMAGDRSASRAAGMKVR